MEIAPGPSLRPLLDSGGTAPAGYPRFTAYFETIAPRTTQGWAQLTGWMKEDWRLVHAPRPELYDLGSDPEESRDRHAEKPEVASALFAELGRFLDENETTSVGQSVGTVDPETVERLAALGYLQADPEALRELDDLLAVEGMIDPKDRVVDISIFSEAKAAMARREWALAEKLWLEVLRRSPDNTYAYQGLAQLYGMTEDWERCFHYLDVALERRPDASSLLRFRGEILIQLGRYQEGLDHLLALPTDSLEAATWIGRALQGLGRGEEAEGWFRKGLETAPGNRWLRLYLANELASRGSFEAAEEQYRTLIADAPYFHLAFYNYGKMLIDRGEPERARGVLERAAALAPQHEMTRTALRHLDAGS
jgi:tetratricopeptide (TPR) repeat protein